MNLLNEKARAIRVSISAEKNKKNPNEKTIQKLQKELEQCLEELNGYSNLM